MMTKKRALITGLAGFTGQYVARSLEPEYEIFGLGANHSELKTYFRADLTDKNVLINIIDQIKPDVIVHLAAVAFVGHNNSNDFYVSNLIGTQNLLQACYLSQPKVESILIASSANVYGNQNEGVFSENSPTNPTNDYAVSKLAMEHMARLWFDKLPIIITRPFNYTGVGQSEQFLIPKIVNHFKFKLPSIELGNLDIWRDFNDVRDVAQTYQALLKTKPHGEIFNVCSGKIVSIRDLINMAQEMTNHHIKIQTNPNFIRKNEVHQLLGDCTKLNHFLGAREHFSLEQTLSWMLKADLNA